MIAPRNTGPGAALEADERLDADEGAGEEMLLDEREDGLGEGSGDEIGDERDDTDRLDGPRLDSSDGEGLAKMLDRLDEGLTLDGKGDGEPGEATTDGLLDGDGLDDGATLDGEEGPIEAAMELDGPTEDAADDGLDDATTLEGEGLIWEPKTEGELLDDGLALGDGATTTELLDGTGDRLGLLDGDDEGLLDELTTAGAALDVGTGLLDETIRDDDGLEDDDALDGCDDGELSGAALGAMEGLDRLETGELDGELDGEDEEGDEDGTGTTLDGPGTDPDEEGDELADGGLDALEGLLGGTDDEDELNGALDDGLAMVNG